MAKGDVRVGSGVCHCGMGRMQKQTGARAAPCAGKSGDVEEQKGDGTGGGVSWELEESSAPGPAQGTVTVGSCHTGWVHQWSESPLRNTDCDLID